jgi:hypothetical protein
MTTARTPTPKTLLCRAHALALVACVLAALHGFGAASAQTPGAAEEVIETAQTPAGELSLVRRRAGEGVTIVIKLGARVVAEKEASEEGDAYSAASIHGLYPAASPRYAVVTLSTGSLVCGSKTTVVDLSVEGAAKATKDFGNCSDSPRVVYRRGALSITFPSGPRRRDPGAHYVGPGQVWTYGGGRLRMVGARR